MAGQQNYIDLTSETYRRDSKKYMELSSEKYFLKKRFGLDVGYDKDKLRYSQLMYNILGSEETELIEWIDKKIKGETGKSKCCKNTNDCCYEEIDNCSLNGCFKWEKVEW